MLIHLVALLALYYGVCVLYHRYVRRTGEVEKFYITVHSASLAGDAPADAGGEAGGGGDSGVGGILSVSSSSSGVDEVVSYYGIAGDLGTALAAEAVLAERVNLRHGVGLGGPPPLLVIDIGAHIGLFSLSVVRESSDAIVVGAEPVPQLHALALRNTAEAAAATGSSGAVFIEQMAVGGAHDAPIELLVNPCMTAGTSAYLSQITQPQWSRQIRNFFAFMRAVGLDNVRAGTLPYFPTATICHALRVPVLRVFVLLLASPLLLLAVIFFYAGPHKKTTVRCDRGTLSELLERAARRAEGEGKDDDSDRSRAIAARIRGPASDISLVRIVAGGGELSVLEGITDGEWARIQQLVVQVHDVSGRAVVVRRMLAAKGFNHVVLDQEDWASHELLHRRTIYAKKIAPPQK